MVNNEECVHGMGSPQFCVLCKGSSLPNIYVTAGGMHYHKTPHCPNLIKGQAQVENPAPIETVPHGSEKMQNRKPCKKCKPGLSELEPDDLFNELSAFQVPLTSEQMKKVKSVTVKAKRKFKNQQANREINAQLAIAAKAYKADDADAVVRALNKAMDLVPDRKDKNGNYTWQSTIDHIVKKSRTYGIIELSNHRKNLI